MSLSAQTRRQLLIATAAFAVLAVFFGMWVWYNTSPKLEPIVYNVATVLPQARIIKDFKLAGTKTPNFTKENLMGHWSLVFFGFTNCPELCPTTLAKLNQAYQILEKDQQNPMPQVVFISVDPDSDSPQRIATYLQGFNKNFLGATGSNQELDQLSQQLNVMYAKITPKEGEHYTIDHTGTIIVVDPKGEFYALFTTPHDANNIAKDFATMTAHYIPAKAES